MKIVNLSLILAVALLTSASAVLSMEVECTKEEENKKRSRSLIEENLRPLKKSKYTFDFCALEAITNNQLPVEIVNYIHNKQITIYRSDFPTEDWANDHILLEPCGNSVVAQSYTIYGKDLKNILFAITHPL